MCLVAAGLRYEGSLVVTSAEEFEWSWRVTGPEKDGAIHTRYDPPPTRSESIFLLARVASGVFCLQRLHACDQILQAVRYRENEWRNN